jgi:hypothetical protein
MVSLSLAGTVLIDFETEPLGKASTQGLLVDALPKGSVSKSINTVPAKDKETMG